MRGEEALQKTKITPQLQKCTDQKLSPLIAQMQLLQGLDYLFITHL